MGIVFLMKSYLEEPTTWWLGIISLHVLAILYFNYVHKFIFKGMQRGGTAVMLTLVGMGIGQAYNRQVIKASIAFGTFITFIIVHKQQIYPLETMVWVLLGIYILGAIDAAWSTTKARENMRIRTRTRLLETKSKLLMKHRKNGHEFAVDTNVLMHDPDVLVHLLETENINLYMSMMVFGELDGLKNNDNPSTRYKAQIAFDVIEAYQRRNRLHILKTPKTDAIRKFGLGGSPDEKIIGTYLRELKSGERKLIFLSNDKGARIIARNVGMPVVEI